MCPRCAELGHSPSMCAGKLLSLIKKCLNRDRERQQRERDRQKEKGGGRTKAHCDLSSSQCHLQHPVRSQNLFPHPNPDTKGGRSSPRGIPGATPGGATPGPSHPHCSSPHSHKCKSCVPYPAAGYSCSTLPHRQTTMCNGSYQAPLVVYVPGASMDSHLLSAEREAALQRERAVRNHSSMREAELNLPPSIAISEDGEEGYAASQRLLQKELHSEVEVEAIRPPPNKTVFQGESPPPYRSHPHGPRHPRKSDCDCQGSSGANRVHHANNNNHANNLNHLGSLHSYGAVAPSAAGRQVRLATGPHGARSGHGSLHHDTGPGGTPAAAGSGPAAPHVNVTPHVTDNNGHSSYNAGSSYGPPPDYSQVAPPTGPPEQHGLFTSNKSMSNSNV